MKTTPSSLASALRALAVLVVLALLVPLARAQLVADSATNTLDNVTNAVAGDMSVGTNGSFTGLLLTNSAYLTNTGNSYVGLNTGADSNAVVLHGTNTGWHMGGDLFVGSNGSFNTLLIEDGGTVANNEGYIGYDSGAHNNQVTVTGAGSLWSNRHDLYVGAYGGSNMLLIANGGRVASSNGYVGFGSNANDNVAVVTGAGSLWTNSANLYVGSNGSGNQLMITDGGVVSNSLAVVGFGALSSNNAVYVSGLGSAWRNANALVVGRSGHGNRVIVSNGGELFSAGGFVGGALYPGGFSNSHNEVWVTGAGSAWNSGGLHVGYGGNANRLVISNGGRVVSFNGTIGGSVLVGDSNEVRVTGTDSLWTNQNSLWLGDGSSWNNLLISDGGRVEALGVIIGQGSGWAEAPSNNFVGVSGSGSILRTTGILIIGYGSGGNRLVIDQGGLVENGNALMGGSSGTSNNEAIVTGPGSFWNNRGDLDIPSTNRLVISDGGLVGNTLGRIYNSSEVVVTGVGSFWSNRSQLFIGSRLVISNGGYVANNEGYIGYSGSTSNNSVLVTGAGSVWSNAGALYVGASGAFSQLIVSNGGRVTALAGVSVGNVAGGSNNSVVAVNGSLSTGGLTLGGTNNSRNNNVTLRSNSVWDLNGGIFSWGIGASNNTLVIDATSTLTNIGTLSLGERDTTFYMTNQAGGYSLNGFKTNQLGFALAGLSNLNVGSNMTRGTRLLISNYSLAITGGGLIGNQSSNTAILVAGSNAIWRSAGNLTIGSGNSLSNQLIVSDGGLVVNSNAVIGAESGARGNTVIVTGSGSAWTNRGSLTIGSGGPSNQVVVAGSGKVWAADLWIGTTSSVNRLTISGGGMVVSGNSQIGFASSSSNNVAVVSGSGSLWTNSGDIYVGNAGAFNTLLITNGGSVQAANAHIGVTAGSSNNVLRLANGTITVTGALTINSNNTLAGTGTITGTLTNRGTINVGNSAGSLTINGSLSLAATAGMVFEIGGLIPTNQHDVVTVTNFVEFAGTLSLSLLPGFLPAAADSFALMSFDSASGGFANVSGGRVTLTNNLASFAVTQTATNLVISGVAYVDTDGDGQGDLQELAAGTNPSLSTSALQVTNITRNASGHTVLKFQSALGKKYRIEYSGGPGPWSIATTNVFSAGTSTTWIDDGSLTGGLPATQRFYRIGLQ